MVCVLWKLLKEKRADASIAKNWKLKKLTSSHTTNVGSNLETPVKEYDIALDIFCRLDRESRVPGQTSVKSSKGSVKSGTWISLLNFKNAHFKPFLFPVALFASATRADALSGGYGNIVCCKYTTASKYLAVHLHDNGCDSQFRTVGILGSTL